MSGWASLGVLLTALGAALAYAGAPHQQVTRTGRHPGRLICGAAAIAAGLPALLAYFGPAAAVFVWLTVAMLVWSVLPLAVAWRRGPKEKAR